MVDSRRALSDRESLRSRSEENGHDDGGETPADDAQGRAVSAAPASDRSGPDTEPDRISALWGAKIYILVVVILVAAGVYAVSKSMTPLYSSSSTVRVSATQAPGGSASDVATASNALAAQYAEVVTSSAVLTPAAGATQTPASTLSSHISSGTVASQNLIRITAQSTKKAQSATWANSVATSLAAYITRQSANQARLIQTSVNSQLAPINAQIATLENQISTESPTALAGTTGYIKVQGEENQLTELLASRSGLLTTTAVSIAADQPQVQVLSTASAPSLVSPKPTLYTLIAAAGALLVACEVALTGARRRFRRHRR
jgi:capsular polysaccharide biosynthesis protein